MENKNTVIDAKIGNLNELTKVLSVKEQAQEQLLVVMQALGIGKIVRNLKFEIVRLWGKTSLPCRCWARCHLQAEPPRNAFLDSGYLDVAKDIGDDSEGEHFCQYPGWRVCTRIGLLEVDDEIFT